MVSVTSVELVDVVSPALQQKAKSWAEFLSAPLIEFSPEYVSENTPASSGFVLEVSEENLRLRDPQRRYLEVDFVKDHVNYKRKGLRGKNELLAKALGGSKEAPRVLDLSAGLGIDALFMTQLGFYVTAVERSRALFVLLEEARSRAAATEPALVANIKFVCASAKEFVTGTLPDFQFDAIYFDPMYPHKKKSALPKQEMVVFRELVGQDEDAAEVLECALQTSAERVVVKRPVGAPSLLPGVRHVYEGKVVRYDVYKR